ncbi:Ig-like domain-containing protein [Synechococcus sp. UW140]|uniref:Ig-like domain-containing protein n=1 Tax=Synechococcus sp. UW140 TaxID=368503 RepID=UPI000E0EC31F|nr:Ig-like domain-containing protein [Synechococcus sp. UW140]
MSQFTQLGNNIVGGSRDGLSGCSVSLSADGSILAIGAPGHDRDDAYTHYANKYGYNAGYTGIYQWNSGSNTWDQLGELIEGDLIDGNQYSGVSVSLSNDGSNVAIGAHSGRGRTRVLQWNSNTNAWVQKGEDIDGEAVPDESGMSVSLSGNGNTLAIGAPRNNDHLGKGHARIFRWEANEWVQRGVDIEGNTSEYIGLSVSLSDDGNIIAVRGRHPGPTGTLKGITRIYQWNSDNSAWEQLGSDIEGEGLGDMNGGDGASGEPNDSVAISGDGTTVAIGAPWNDGSGSGSDYGHTRIYQWDGNEWVQHGSDIDGEAAGDRSGFAVSLSDDGSIVAIGAMNNDDNGAYSGHTRIYQWSGTSWVQIGTDIDGQAGDVSGTAVSLSSDGSTVAIGSHSSDGDAGQRDTGSVRVFSLDNTPPTITISSDVASLKAGETATLTFTLSEDSSNFIESDVTVSGGAISGFSGSGTSYSATFTPSANSTTDAVISVASAKFSDSAGNTNADGSDANNSVSLTVDTVRPTFQSAATNTGGTKVILTYSETLSSTTAAIGTFSVTTASKDNPVTDVAIAGSTAELTLTNTIKKTETITVAYSDPTSSNDTNAVQDSVGNDAATLSAQSVTNNSTVAADSSSDDSTSNHNASRDSDSGSTLLLNDNNSFSVTAGANQGLWLNLKVLSASTSLQNSLILIDQNNNVLGSIGATQFSTNCGSHAIFIPDGSTISFQQSSNNQPINSSPQHTINQQSDGTYKLQLNDNTRDSDHDDLIIDISYSATSPNPNATSMAAEQQEIHDAILDLSSIPTDGQTLQITLNSDCSFINRFALVKLNQTSSGEFTVGGFSNTATDPFEQAVRDSLINPGGSITTATGVQEKIIEWSLSSTDAGFYAPVMISALGDLHTVGSSHVKNLGCNLFAFEDDSRISTSDYDFNDLTTKFQIIT